MLRRKKYLVKSIFQFKYASLLVFAILFIIAVVGWNIYYEAGSMILDRARTGDVTGLVDAFNRMLLKSVPIILMFVVIVSIFISHEIAGPIVHLENSIRRISQGDFTEIINLRKGDEFKELALIFNQMTASLNKMASKDRENVQRVVVKLEELKERVGDQKQLAEEIDKIIQKAREISSQYKL